MLDVNLENYFKEIINNQKQTNSLLQNLINIISTSFDMAIGGDTFNKDFLESEVRKSFDTD
jgi:hypothetical protein